MSIHRPLRRIPIRDREYYLVFKRDGEIDKLEYKLDISYNFLADLPYFFTPLSISDLHDYMLNRQGINNTKVPKYYFKLIEDAICVASDLGVDTKIYFTYEEKREEKK